MFQIGELPWGLKLCLQHVLKDGKDDEAMFQGVDGTCELIFCIPGIERSDLYEVA
jgi:hypothetical protein